MKPWIDTKAAFPAYDTEQTLLYSSPLVVDGTQYLQYLVPHTWYPVPDYFTTLCRYDDLLHSVQWNPGT